MTSSNFNSATTSWTTYVRLTCSFHEIGKTSATAVNLHNRMDGDEDDLDLSQDPIRWDVRVNADQCSVIVLVFTDAAC